MVAAVLRYNQASAQGVPRASGIGFPKCEPVGKERVREHMRVAGGFCGVDQAVRDGHRVVATTDDPQSDDQGGSTKCAGVATACQLGATPLNPSFGLPDRHVSTASPARSTVRDLMTTVENDLGGLAVADSRLGPSSRVALRRHQIQGREPGVVDGAGGFDEVFGPGYWLEIIDPKAEEWRVGRDDGGHIEVALVGGPPECCAQIGKLGGEPVVGLLLAGAVPQGEDVGFSPGEVAGMGGPRVSCSP